MSVCLYAISKNEETNVPQFLKAAKMFDHCVVLDTGSLDNTVELLRAGGVTVYEKSYPNFDFSQARNDAMRLVPEKYDWLVSLDFNEILDISQDEIDLINTSEYHGLTMNCYDRDNTAYLEKKLKIHRKDRFFWKFAVHEFLCGVDDTATVGDSSIKVTKNLSNWGEKHELYRVICEREHAANPTESHYAWWASTEYENIDRARYRYFCEQYLITSEPYRVEFRVYAFIGLSNLYKEHNVNKAIDYAFHALSESLIFKDITLSPFTRAIRHLDKLGITINMRTHE